MIDPTENVKELVLLNVKRLDDIRTMEFHRQNDLRVLTAQHLKDEMELRASFNLQLSAAEAKRIDAIRAVDVNAVAVANERAAAQATVLANQVAASAEALRALVASTASTVAAQLAQTSTQLTERLTLLERAQYEGAGRRTETDPVMQNLLAEVRELRSSTTRTTGSTSGSQQMAGWLFAGVMALVTIGFGLYTILHR